MTFYNIFKNNLYKLICLKKTLNQHKNSIKKEKKR